MSGAFQTFHGYVETTRDSLLLFEACRQGILPRVSRRLQEKERKLVQSGAIFCFDEDESGIKRWTDGLMWSPSRILGNFLVYRELDDKRMTEDDPSVGIRSQHQRNGMPVSKRQQERALFGSLKNSYRFKKDGLIKKSISLVVNGVQQHLISYYNKEDVLANKFVTPSNTPELASLEISPDLLVRQNFRIPPFLDGDGMETVKKCGTKTPPLLITSRLSGERQPLWQDVDQSSPTDFRLTHTSQRQKRRSSPLTYPSKSYSQQSRDSIVNVNTQNNPSYHSLPAALPTRCQTAPELRRISPSSLSPSSPSSSSDFYSVPETAAADPLENAQSMHLYPSPDGADNSAPNTAQKYADPWRVSSTLTDYIPGPFDSYHSIPTHHYNSRYSLHGYPQHETFLNAVPPHVSHLAHSSFGTQSGEYEMKLAAVSVQQQQPEQHYDTMESHNGGSALDHSGGREAQEWCEPCTPQREAYSASVAPTMNHAPMPDRGGMLMYDPSALLTAGWNEFALKM